MTKIIKRKLYCSHCEKYFTVPVVLSTNSLMIEKDPKMKQAFGSGKLFGANKCPVCGKELVKKDNE